MIISNLNYLESVPEGLEDIAGGRGRRRSVNGPTRRKAGFNKEIDIDFDADFKVDTDVNIGISGNGATGDSYAEGKNTFTEAYTEVVEDNYSLSEAAAFVS